MRGKRIAVFLLVLVAVMGADGECESNSSSGPPKGRAFACDMKPHDKPIYHEDADIITGAVKVVCDTPPRSHDTTVKLQRSFNGAGVWETQAIEETSKLPPAGKGMLVTAVFDGCITGVWRIRASADGVGPDGKPFHFNLPASEYRATGIKCPGPKG